MILPVTLTAAGCAALINIWLAMRVGRVRTAEKISIGDGAHPGLTARMRAHANFVEYTPFVLLLLGLIELARGTSLWLWLVAAVYLLGRIAHGLGMDAVPPAPHRLRMVGTLVTMLTLLGLGLWAVAIPYVSGGRVMPVEMLQAG